MNNLNSDPDNLDVALAQLADRLMSDPEAAKLDLAGGDSELADLQQTVRHLKRTFDASGPTKLTADRIRANLVREWEQTHRPEQQTSWWNRLKSLFASGEDRWVSNRRQRQAYALSLAGLMTLFLIAVWFLGSPTGGETGAVLKGPIAVLIGALLVVLAGGFILWMTRKR